MSTIKFDFQELKEVVQTIQHYIITKDLTIKYPDAYEWLYNENNNKEDFQLQEIYLNNIFNRIHYINSLAHAVNYNHTIEEEDLKHEYYLNGVGTKHFTMKELFKKIDSVEYNLDDFLTIEIKNLFDSIRDQIARKLIIWNFEED